MLHHGLTALKTIMFFILVVFLFSHPTHSSFELIELETAEFLANNDSGIIYEQVKLYSDDAHKVLTSSLSRWVSLVAIRVLITCHDFMFVGLMIIVFTTNAVLYLNRLEAARHQVNVIFDKAFRFLVFFLVISFAMIFTHRHDPTYALNLIYATMFCITVGIGLTKLFGVKS